MAFNGLGDKRRALRPPGSRKEEIEKPKKKNEDISYIHTEKRSIRFF